MGLREDDYMLHLHRQVAWPGFRRELRRHREADAVDLVAVIPPASWAGVLSAAQTSDAAFWDALQALPGGAELCVDLPASGLSTLRQLVLDLISTH